MREILFRGKRIDNGEWVEGSFVYWPEEDEVDTIVNFDNVDFPGNVFGDHVEVHRETVGQFTGMFDAGGKKIFEGDIMTTAVGGLKINTGVVEFSDGAFGLRCISGDALFLCFVAGSFMVIGNIHDNPELMK